MAWRHKTPFVLPGIGLKDAWRGLKACEKKLVKSA